MGHSTSDTCPFYHAHHSLRTAWHHATRHAIEHLGRLRPLLPSGWRHWLPEACTASGWAMYAGCADADGIATCPWCEQRIGTHTDYRFGAGKIRVLNTHRRPL